MSAEINKMLQGLIDKVIVIKLKDNRIINATLKSFDEQMNLSLTDAKDVTEGIVDLNDILLRGSMIISVSAKE